MPAAILDSLRHWLMPDVARQENERPRMLWRLSEGSRKRASILLSGASPKIIHRLWGPGEGGTLRAINGGNLSNEGSSTWFTRM